jgi:aspartate/methionine/tyrosine aminotransferase
LNEIQGIECHSPKGAIYVFPKITGTGYSSAEFCNLILSECSIAATPGHFFGTFGEGFVRFSTVNNEEQICLAVERLKNLFGTKN